MYQSWKANFLRELSQLVFIIVTVISKYVQWAKQQNETIPYKNWKMFTEDHTSPNNEGPITG